MFTFASPTTTFLIVRIRDPAEKTAIDTSYGGGGDGHVHCRDGLVVTVKRAFE